MNGEGVIGVHDFHQWFGEPASMVLPSPTEPHIQTTVDADDDADQLWNDPPPTTFHPNQSAPSANQTTTNGNYHPDSHSTQRFNSGESTASQSIPSPPSQPSSTPATGNMQHYPAIQVVNGTSGTSQPQSNTAMQPTYYSNGSAYAPSVGHYSQTTNHVPTSSTNGTSYNPPYMAYGSGMSPNPIWQNGGIMYSSNSQPVQMTQTRPEARIDTMLSNNPTPPPTQTTNPMYGHSHMPYPGSPPVSSAVHQAQPQRASYSYNLTPEQLQAIQQQPIPHVSNQAQPRAYRAAVVAAPRSQHPRVQQAQSASPMPTMSPGMMHMANSPVPYSATYADIFSSGSPYSHAQSNPASINPQALSQPTPSTSAPAQKPQQPLVNTVHMYKQYMQPQMMDAAPAQTAKNLINVLTAENTPETDPETRLWLLTRIRDGAGKEFFKTWANDAEGMMLVKEWLRAATPSKDPDGNPADWQETIMPLLQVIDRLPLGINQLRKSKIGSNILKLAKNPPNGAIRDLASSLENRYRQLMESHQLGGADDGKAGGKRTEADARGVKRKSDTPPIKTTAPAKRVPIATPSTAAAAAARLLAARREKEKALSGAVTKETKSDSSFFTDTKPKPAPVKRVLPSFTKKSASPAAVDVAQPSSRNTFEEALAHMGVKPKASTPTVPEPMEGVTPTGSRAASTDPSKKRKRVTFKPEEQLVQIRWIEKAIYDDDDDALGASHSVKDLDRDEGAAMHKQLTFEELIDWSEPMALSLPDSQLGERGQESEEATTQTEREKTALLAHYLPGEMPPSPEELPAHLQPTGDDAQTKMMLAGEDIDSLAEKPVSVAELLAKMGGPPATSTGIESTAPMFGSLKDLGIDPNTFTQMLQQHNIAPVLAPPEPAVPQVQALSGPEWGANGGGGRGEEAGWNEQGSYYDRPKFDDRGRGGRGRGRGRGGRPDNDRGQKLCYFYPLGKCKYGDQCHNLHVG